MGTTNLVVELMVIGVGAVAAVFLAAMTVFGIQWVPVENLLAVQSVIPMLAITYVLGILMDRLADRAFEKWSTKIRETYFKRLGDYHDARRTILTRSDSIGAVVRYGRSRMRVVRGWSVNGALLSVSGAAFIAAQVDDNALRRTLLSFHLLTTIALTVGCMIAWSRLSKSEYLKIRESAKFLKGDPS